MENLKNKADQEKMFREILSKYDEKTQKLYFGVLKHYTEKGHQVPKTTMRNDILDMIKGVVK